MSESPNEDGAVGLQGRLLNEFQRDLPLTPRPYAKMAQQLGSDEQTIIESLQGLRAQGIVSRVGPVIRPHAIGASALVAMAVPRERLAEVASLVSAQPEVNHNYERDHDFNLWFVVTASDAGAVRAAIARVEGACGLPVMVLPMLDDYYIDLGFDLHSR